MALEDIDDILDVRVINSNNRDSNLLFLLLVLLDDQSARLSSTTPEGTCLPRENDDFSSSFCFDSIYKCSPEVPGSTSDSYYYHY